MTPAIVAQGLSSGDAIVDLLPSVWRMAGSLLVVLALLAGLAYLLRRSLAVRRAAGAMTIESSLGLGDRRSLAVVRIEGRRLLLGLAPGQVTMVAELSPATFEAALQRTNGEGQP